MSATVFLLKFQPMPKQVRALPNNMIDFKVGLYAVKEKDIVQSHSKLFPCIGLPYYRKRISG
ncbi:MAG: hypothetical protein JXR97_14050, partial [Planctomycetes bacterium]|nr:hypothetical protein [Planctomycetota bacterium]